jgi:hypothetical protein
MELQIALEESPSLTTTADSDEEAFCALATEFGAFVNKTVCSRNDGKFNQDDFDELMATLFVKRHLLDGVTNDDNPYNRLNVVRSIIQENPYDPRTTWKRVQAKYALGAASE